MGFKAIHYEQVPINQVEESGAEGVKVRWVINKEDDGAEHFAMRIFEIASGGYTPEHSHSWEHEVYVIEGEGIVFHEGSKEQIRPGFVIFIPPNDRHQFKNICKKKLRILCLIPYD